MNHDDNLYIAELIRAATRDSYRKAASLLGPRVYALAFEIAGNREDAEEVVSDTLLKVFRDISLFDPGRGSFLSWTLRIAHNKAISLMRERARRPAGDVISADCISTLPENTCDKSDMVNEAISRCSQAERELIQLYYYENMSLNSISEITGVAAGTLAVRLQRIRQKIKLYIDEHE